MLDVISPLILNSGAAMPRLGLGTWKSEPGKVGAAVQAALECGYRHIDCAAVYGNEPEIGHALQESYSNGVVERKDVYITSKLWNTEHKREDVARACRKTLEDLHLKYLDLYLIHWGIATPPVTDHDILNARGEPLDDQGVLKTDRVSLQETWQAMEKLVQEGLVRSIGVANFTAPMLLDLISYASVPPAMNQIELHPYHAQSALVDFCHDRGVAVTAYSPLGSPGNVKARGNSEPILLEDERVKAIADRLGKSPAQVLIRWGIQRNSVVIPKSVTPEKIISNGQVFDFELAQEDMDTLCGLDRKHRYVDPSEWWKIPYFN